MTLQQQLEDLKLKLSNSQAIRYKSNTQWMSKQANEKMLEKQIKRIEHRIKEQEIVL